MDNFIKGSSIVAALPTFLYVGYYQMQNRNYLLKTASSPDLKSFLSIPYEIMVIGILVSYGITYSLMKRNIDVEDSNVTKLTKVAIHGAILGVILSIIGRFALDLPVKMFKIPRNKAFSVHPSAFILYIFIFLYVYYITL